MFFEKYYSIFQKHVSIIRKMLYLFLKNSLMVAAAEII